MHQYELRQLLTMCVYKYGAIECSSIFTVEQRRHRRCQYKFCIDFYTGQMFEYRIESRLPTAKRSTELHVVHFVEHENLLNRRRCRQRWKIESREEEKTMSTDPCMDCVQKMYYVCCWRFKYERACDTITNVYFLFSV